MRQIAHISDLHFGTEEPPIAEGLLADLAALAPNVVVVSGDLTQRARRSQFQAAAAYLARITPPKVVVPGNHDMPLYDFLHRMTRPLSRYRKYITREMFPVFQDDEIAVAGINTARPDMWKEGRISLAQLAAVRTRFDSLPRSLHKVLVTHHPFIPPKHDPKAGVVGRAKLAVKTLEACGCHILLAGHLHQAYSGDVRMHHVKIKRSILVVQAGTAFSHRRRNEPNAYNYLTIDGDRLVLQVRAWDGQNFTPTTEQIFDRVEGGWIVRAG